NVIWRQVAGPPERFNALERIGHVRVAIRSTPASKEIALLSETEGRKVAIPRIVEAARATANVRNRHGPALACLVLETHGELVDQRDVEIRVEPGAVLSRERECAKC